MDQLKEKLAVEIHNAIQGINKDLSLTLEFIHNCIEFPQDTSKGDYAFPCFRLAKSFRRKPDLIANEIKEILEKRTLDYIQKVDSVTGFLNISMNKISIAEELFSSVEEKSFFEVDEKNKKVMVEYSQPNTHKEFHVGHGRNVCLGDSITRLYKYFGYETIGANYIGDEGTHIAKCLFAVKRHLNEMPDQNRAEWLGTMYVEANRLLKEANEEEKKKINQELSEILAAIESKNGDTYALWKDTRKDCLDDFNKIYDWLDVHFDHFFYESEVSGPAQNIVKTYMDKGVFYEDNGAIGIDMKDQKLGFFMARKSDGNTLYITKDIALAEQKFDEFKIDFNIYVVGNEQDFHFKQLFNFFKFAKFENADKCFHLSYGMVKRADGKMSSRQGNSFTFLELTNLVNNKLAEHLKKYEDEWTTDEVEDIKRKLAVGAIKYGMLSSDPKKDIVFEPEDWIRFDGNSGPYLMYSYSRCQSILNKGKELGHSPSLKNLHHLRSDVEGELIFQLYKFNTMAEVALNQFKPSFLCNYLYELAKIFSQLYVQIPVLKDATKEEIEARLSLINSFSTVLHKGLELIGITPPQKM
ncbi:MAG: arginine--tRNA ligase [Bacteriovoracaceae bacterium]|nr:arginine--tRNA ligase [Bacteriovoracaceae bacterium]